MDVRVGLWRKLSAEELMLLNCGVGEDPWESRGLQGDPTSPFEGDQPWDFFGRNDAKAETPVLWSPHAKNWLIGKDFDAGRDWGQEEKGTTEDEMAGWHHRLDGQQYGWTPGDGDGQGGLACCDSWGRKELDTTKQLNWTELGGTSGKEPVCQCRRHKRQEFYPWVGKILWRRAWQPTTVFLTGEPHWQRSLAGYNLLGGKDLGTTEETLAAAALRHLRELRPSCPVSLFYFSYASQWIKLLNKLIGLLPLLSFSWGSAFWTNQLGEEFCFSTK